MHIDLNDHKAVNEWVRKASEEGAKRPRAIVEAAKMLDSRVGPGIAYCDGCNRAVFDTGAIDSAMWMDDSEEIFLTRLEGAREAFFSSDDALCIECMATQARERQRTKL